MSADKRYRAEWWHKSGFKTSGTFDLPSEAEVRRVIEESGGRVISIVEKK